MEAVGCRIAGGQEAKTEILGSTTDSTKLSLNSQHTTDHGFYPEVSLCDSLPEFPDEGYHYCSE